MPDREREKERAGRRAADLVKDGMRVGLGTGSTVEHTIVSLAERRLDIACAATSERTRERAAKLGLRVLPPDELGALDLAIDGADEVDPDRNLIKGGGGAHAREKIVAELAERFVVVVDASKVVEVLGAFGLPLEVLPFAPLTLAARVRALGARDVRLLPQPSDNGNALLHADFGLIREPAALAAGLSALPGMVEHGLFLGSTVERVIVADGDAIREIGAP